MISALKSTRVSTVSVPVAGGPASVAREKRMSVIRCRVGSSAARRAIVVTTSIARWKAVVPPPSSAME